MNKPPLPAETPTTKIPEENPNNVVQLTTHRQTCNQSTIECLEEVRRSVGALRSAPKSHHS